MIDEYICVLVTPKKYKEMLEEINGLKCVILPKKHINDENNEQWCEKIETISSLPVRISTASDEEIKYVTKEEYEQIQKQEIKLMDDFFKEYEPDYMWK